MPLDRTDRLLLFALIALNAVLKFNWLGVNELAGDEPFTVYWSLRGMPEILHMLQDENNPPLYFLIMKAWAAMVPLEAAWLRIPSAVFSILTAWPLFLLARRLAGRSVAITTVLLFTFSSHHFGFAHEVRAYALFTLLTVAGFAQLTLMRDRSAVRSRDVAAIAAIDVLLVYTHFFGWLAIGMQLVCAGVCTGWRPLWRSTLIAAGIALLGYLPYVPIFLGRTGKSVVDGTWVTTPTWEEPYNMLWRWSNQPMIAVPFLAAVLWGTWKSRLRAPALQMGLLWSFVPLIGLFLVSFVVPVYVDRYLVWAAPGFALAVAASLAQVPHARLHTALSVAACASMLLTMAPWKDNGRRPGRVVAQVHAWSAPDQAVALFPHHYDLTYAYHLDASMFRTDTSVSRSLGARRTFAVYPHDTLPVFDPTDQVLLVRSGDGFPALYAGLRSRYADIDSVEADHRVWVYRFRH